MDNFELRFLPIVHNIMVGNTMAGSCRWSSGGLKCPGSEQDKCTSGGSGHSCWCRVAFLILQFLVWFLRMHVFLSMNVPKAPIQIAPPLKTCTKCCKVLSEKRPFSGNEMVKQHYILGQLFQTANCTYLTFKSVRYRFDLIAGYSWSIEKFKFTVWWPKVSRLNKLRPWLTANKEWI